MTKHLLTLAAAALALASAGPPAEAQFETPCFRSANQMWRSCRAEANEEQFAGLAVCNTIADAGDRNDCKDGVEEELLEARMETCDAQLEARNDACDDLGEVRHQDPLTDPMNEFVDLDEIGDTVAPNPWFSLEVGHTFVLRAGEEMEETVVVTVTNNTKEINGQACRVVADVVVVPDEEDDDEERSASRGEGGPVEYVPVEVTDDFYTQTITGDVIYCGEDTVEIGDQEIRDGTDGSFYSGNEDGAHAGYLVRANPMVGVAHRQEMSLGEAEDIIEYVALDAVPGDDEERGDNEAFPCAPDGCLQTLDTSPLEPDHSEYKYYKEGLGFVLAVALEDDEPTGEREELLCVGDSLDVLADESCGIENLAGLLETLCEYSPNAFCDDDGPGDEE